MKSIIWSKTTFIIACLVLLSVTACRQKSSPSGGKQLSAEEYAKMKAEAAVDSVALQESKGASQDTALFTYAMAMEIVQPILSAISLMLTGVATVRPSVTVSAIM